MIAKEVIYTQEVFRVLLAAMSQPGTIEKIEEFPTPGYFSPYEVGIAKTLLDVQVTCAFAQQDKEKEQFFKALTGCSFTRKEEADYYMTTGEDADSLRLLKRGNLAYCDENATVICAVDSIGRVPMSNCVTLKLTGSGIEETNTVCLRGLTREFIVSWQECNKEYPLGVDMIFYDKSGNVCCVPRSTKVKGLL